MKKFLKFFALLVVVAILAFILSLAVSRGGGNSVEDTSLLKRFEVPTETKISNTEITTKITTEESSFPFLIPGSTELRYYHARSGEIKKLDLSKLGTPQVITTIKSSALAIVWSVDGNDILARYGDTFSHTDLSTKETNPLDRKILAPIFSKSDSTVAYLYFDDTSGEGTISIADGDFKNFKNIIKTRLKNWEIQWNDSRRLSLIATSNTTKLKSLYILDIDQKGLLQAIEGQRDLAVLSSPDGEHILYSKLSRSGTILSILDTSRKVSREIPLHIPVSKCAWSTDSKSFFCAAPQNNETEDSFIEIAVSSLAQTTLRSSAETGFAEVREMIYVHTISSLVYKNLKDGRLYILRLNR